MHHFIYLCLLTLLYTFPLAASSSPFESLKEAPVVYKGRFRPSDPQARLWLNDIYHSEHIKRSDQNAFLPNDGTAHDLLWKMHFLGHAYWDNAPLFWIQDLKLKNFLGLSETQNRFTYNQLYYALYENEESNLRFMRTLLTYHFIKKFQDSNNRSLSEKQELLNLSPNLWVMLHGESIEVLRSPNTPPWNFLKPGMILAENGRFLSDIYVNANKNSIEEGMRVLATLQHYASMSGHSIPSELNLELQLAALQQRDLPSIEIAQILDSQFPLNDRLNQSDSQLRMLPSKRRDREWLPLKALNVQVYDPLSNRLEPVKNFTVYPDPLFDSLRATYRHLQAKVLLLTQMHNSGELNALNGEIHVLAQKLNDHLHEGYAALEGTSYKMAMGKMLVYPTFNQLKAELAYYKFPFSTLTIILYGVSLFLFIVGYLTKKPLLNKIAFTTTLFAFLFHTFILAMRCYILQRPPVSNMFETIVYVPWMSVLTGFGLCIFFKRYLPLIAGMLSAFVLLIILEFTGLNNSLENVQAVLDSQYWLIIHVLLVVGSYGAFVLCGILGHFYLFGYAYSRSEPSTVAFLGKCILQVMYIGLAMLIPGTILGGIWAAESWGRFWDWDPKESWAFISICTYLVCVHAYRFHHIKYFGLAIGSIIGLQVISFTWYGVNYILGTGLHSYGFGSGGDFYYYLFLISEIIFLTFMVRLKKLVDKKNFKANLMN